MSRQRVIKRRLGQQHPHGLAKIIAEGGRSVIHIGHDAFTAIHHGDEILQVVAGMVVVATSINKRHVFGREKPRRRNELQPRVGDLSFCRSRPALP